MSTNVIDFANLSITKNEVYCPTVVFDVEPVTDIFAVAIYRKGLVCQAVLDLERDELFRILVWAIVVGATGDICGEFVGVNVGFND